MAKVIVYQCDFCDFRTDATITGGMKEGRVLRPTGWSEACDDCVRRAIDYLTHLRDNKDDQGS